jgi:hypothetical protein
MHRLAPLGLLLSMLSLTSVARAESAVPLVWVDDPMPLVRADANADVREPGRAPSHVGFEVGAGVPSGASAQLILAPWPALRLQAGGSHDGVGPGVLGGITLAPFNDWFAPVLSVTAGRMFESDGTAQVRRYVELNAVQAQVAQRLGYDFLSAELGVEVGLAGRFVVALHAGVAGVRGTLHGLGPAIGMTSSQLQLGEVNVRAVVPSARLGFVFFI